MAPDERGRGHSRGCGPHRGHHDYHHRHHHHHPRHHSPPPPDFFSPPGFMEPHRGPHHWDPRFSHHHGPHGHGERFHHPPPHHGFRGGPYGQRCWSDPRGAWWGSSSDEEDTDLPGDGERCFPRPGGRRGRGGGCGRGGFGRHFFGPGWGPPHHGFGLAPHLLFGHPWFEDSDSDSSSEDEGAAAGYQATLDLGPYKKKNISVRVTGRHLTVEAKGGERQGSSRRSCRRYFVEHRILPKKTDGCRVSAVLNSDGLLTVRAPPREQETEDEEAGICEREVQVQADEQSGERAGECMDADVDVQGQDNERDE